MRELRSARAVHLAAIIGRSQPTIMRDIKRYFWRTYLVGKSRYIDVSDVERTFHITITDDQLNAAAAPKKAPRGVMYITPRMLEAAR